MSFEYSPRSEKKNVLPPPPDLHSLNLNLLSQYSGDEQKAFLRGWEIAARRKAPVGKNAFEAEQGESDRVYPEEYIVMSPEEQGIVLTQPDDLQNGRKVGFGVPTLEMYDSFTEQVREVKKWQSENRVVPFSEFRSVAQLQEALSKKEHRVIDGLFAIPKISAVAAYVRSQNEGIQGTDYELALRHALRRLHEVREADKRWTFENWFDENLDSQYQRLHPRTAFALAKLEATIEGDFLIIPVQTGLVHRGESARYSLDHLEERRTEKGAHIFEYGLDPYMMACILLTHPERAHHPDDSPRQDLGVRAIGSQRCSWPGSAFEEVPHWSWNVPRRVVLDESWFSHADAAFGGASAFLPVV